MNPNSEQSNDPNVTPVEQPVPTSPTVNNTTPAPATPFQPASNGPIPPQKNKKNLLIGLIAGGAALLLLIAAVIVYFLFFTVTKADYRAANEQLNTVSRTVAVRPSINSSSEPDQAVAELKTSVENYKKENAKLGDLKALRADGDLNQKYKAYNEKATAYIAMLDSFVPSLGKFLTATQAVSGLRGGATPAQYDEVAKVIAANKDVSDPTLKTYLNSLSDTYTAISQIRQRSEAASSSSERLAASRELLTQTQALSAATRTLTQDLEKRYNDVNPRTSFNDLTRAVADKANQ